MDWNYAWQEERQIGAESGPIAIGDIMPAVLARYGLTENAPQEVVTRLGGDVVPSAGVLVEV